MIWRCDLTKQYDKYKNEIDDAIQKVLHSGSYTLGDEVNQFEKEFAEYIGVEHAVGVASGTDALILSLKALDIEKGDEIITTPFTAIATVSAIIAAGAKPVFVDIDPDTYLTDIEKIPKAITPNTKAIIPVHIFGNVVDIDEIRSITNNKITIIEDACQAHGSAIKNKTAGSLGDMSCFSFYPTKNVGGYGDGGMITTNNEDLAKKIKLLRMYGMIDKDHIVINGINSRLDELQAAILRVKLRHLDSMNEARHKIASMYKNELAPKYFMHQKINNNVYTNYHVFASRYKGNREHLIEYLWKYEIQTNIYYPIPLHLQKANMFLGYKIGDLPNAEKLCEQVIALPMYPELDKADVIKIISRINEGIKLMP